MRNVVLIDGHSLLFRAYHALPKIFTDQEGNPTNAVYGFFSMLLRVVADLKPSYLAVAFDEKGPTFRHQELVTYKEGRPEMDKELSVQGPVVKELLRSFAIPLYSIGGYEGEDIIATIIKKLKMERGKGKVKEEISIYIVSSDRDVLQLVNEQVKVYSPKKGLSEPVIYGPENVAEVFGVMASQIPDFKGLRGDASDRIPGVFGIGEKTAASLINEFASVENIYKNLTRVEREFGETVFKKLSEGAEAAVMSKKIAQINSTAPFSLNLEQIGFGGLNAPEGIEMLRRLNFKSLLRRLGYTEESQEKKPNKKKGRAVDEGQPRLL